MRHSRTVQMYLMDLLHPNCCPCCRKSIPWNAYLCDACHSVLEATERTFCPLCGKLLENCLCGTGLFYDRALVVTTYEGVGKSGVLSLKTAENLQFAYYCGESLGKAVLEDSALQAYDMIVPVPMAIRKQINRICNPASAIAREISRTTKIPMRTDILKNNGKGNSQHLLTAQERIQNVEQFLCRPVDLSGYRILLCDDVLTTGSTLNRCAGLLKAQGAEAVAVAVATTTPYRKLSSK